MLSSRHGIGAALMNSLYLWGHAQDQVIRSVNISAGDTNGTQWVTTKNREVMKRSGTYGGLVGAVWEYEQETLETCTELSTNKQEIVFKIFK